MKTADNPENTILPEAFPQRPGRLRLFKQIAKNRIAWRKKFSSPQSLGKWELALLIGLFCTVLSGFVTLKKDAELSDKLLRLHVVANSDSPEDQAIKLEARDAVLEACEPYLQNCSGRDQAVSALEPHLDKIAEAAENVLRSGGFNYAAEAIITEMSFPTREYEGFSLPAGRYTALRVELGEAEGANWWCVVFPPLCTAAASGILEESAEAAGLSEDELNLITKENEGYVLRFKCLEWLSKWFDKKGE